MNAGLDGSIVMKMWTVMSGGVYIMYMISGEMMQYHEQRAEELTRSYQDSKWQEAQFRSQISAFASRVRSWFDSGVETSSGAGSRLDTSVIQVEGS
jgi:hypothetical protein